MPLNIFYTSGEYLKIPRNIETQKSAIGTEISKITKKALQNVIVNFKKRLVKNARINVAIMS